LIGWIVWLWCRDIVEAIDFVARTTQLPLGIKTIAAGAFETRLQVGTAVLQSTCVVEGAVRRRAEGALAGALGKLELAVLRNVAATIRYLRRGALVTGQTLALYRRENGARGTGEKPGLRPVFVAPVVHLAVVGMWKAALLLALRRTVVQTVLGNVLHAASAARTETLEKW